MQTEVSDPYQTRHVSIKTPIINLYASNAKNQSSRKITKEIMSLSRELTNRTERSYINKPMIGMSSPVFSENYDKTHYFAVSPTKTQTKALVKSNIMKKYIQERKEIKLNTYNKRSINNIENFLKGGIFNRKTEATDSVENFMKNFNSQKHILKNNFAITKMNY
jgi:hypothetical protein